MIISLIAAMDKNNLIGNGSKIPWQLPSDQKHFRKVTLGKPVVMGRKTFETLKEPLDNRLNIILTRNPEYKVSDDCLLAHSIDDILKIRTNSEELMICGGAPVYQSFLPLADRFYLTVIDHTFDGDVYFPKFDRTEWNEVDRIICKPDKKNKYTHSFYFLER